MQCSNNSHDFNDIKLNFIIDELKNIKNDITDIKNKIDKIDKHIDFVDINNKINKMDGHIDFINHVYNKVENPLNFVTNKINNLIAINPKSDNKFLK